MLNTMYDQITTFGELKHVETSGSYTHEYYIVEDAIVCFTFSKHVLINVQINNGVYETIV